MQSWIKVRNGIFAEKGYNLEPEAELKAGTTVYFATLGADGKRSELDPVIEGDDGQIAAITLYPYPNEEKALAALQMMLHYSDGADDGDPQAVEAFAFAWKSMIFDGLLLMSQDDKGMLYLLSHLYGKGRINDELNTKGTLRFMAATAPSWPELVREALPQRALAA